MAFEIASQEEEDVGAAVRRRMRDEMTKCHLLECMTRDIQLLLRAEAQPVQADVVRLWDEHGTVPNGLSYGKEREP